ncbi:hypothetical protein H8M03_10295 [Sphingomonas sabuli]|uniref:Uncharacterized protein n=1 Tax=Sphingomonas sabuli TaxID=2764186 RepID=A0A7G9L195_9SPHN|nr:hypothetical protein [Sphingomonas sabuli]QNM82394.1 hypothetical protein H8M03_10295 [Sphingomonas sabuli]
MATAVQDVEMAPQVFREKIGDVEWLLEETTLDVNDDVTLWVGNPRLRAVIPTGHLPDEIELESLLQKSSGYAGLAKSIKGLGQMEAIYAWRPNNSSKYHVWEGATRVTILRDLNRKDTKGTGEFRRVRAKILPPNFSKAERALLLAKIHVRGPNVRGWGRFEQAQFVYETTEGVGTEPALMTATKLAAQMGKSVGWVTKLRQAYEFACKFVDHVDQDDGQKMAADNFSILEEISNAPKVGPMLREYHNSQHDELRADVFDMVRNDVFKEYRNARFMREFYEDGDKWAQLKSGEKHIADKLAAELKANASSMKAKIAGLEKQVQRAIERNSAELDDTDADILRRCSAMIEDQIHADVPKFKLELKRITQVLTSASKADVLELSTAELQEFKAAQDYFEVILGLAAKVSA